jgi:hypothetical protein
MQTLSCHGIGFGRTARVVSGFVLLVTAVAIAQAKPARENLHVPNADCAHCHTADRPMLEENPVAAPHQLVPDLEQRCSACHDEGPSHRTGVAPHNPVPELPLSDSGLITCATCHFIHGEQNPHGDFVRIDNSRGGLCLKCHKLGDLQ